MKCDVEQPAALVDITRLTGLAEITVSDTLIRIGSLSKMSQVAQHPALQNAAPALTQSLTSAASAQLRNMATIGGNIMQRTRCSYFRDAHGYHACNKRQPGSGCAALSGHNANHAVLGNSEQCVAVYPGDLAVALTAFDAALLLQRPTAANAAWRWRIFCCCRATGPIASRICMPVKSSPPLSCRCRPRCVARTT
ncbi:hypothetical protein HA44_22420 [Mixta gaviniae]|nr:hypothetical protein HA44_22420 [Mixta gaviniae]